MRILILGDDPGTLDKSFSSINMLTYGVRSSLQKRSGVEVLSEHSCAEEFPEADFVVVIIYAQTKFDFERVREKTRCKRLVTLREVKFTEADHCFIFNIMHAGKYNFTEVPFPCFKSILSYEPKVPYSILIDHYWNSYFGTNKDWTYRIEYWLEPYAFKRPISKLVKDQIECEHNTRRWAKPLYLTNYIDYLDKTRCFEKFVITHHESFPYGVIDMAARGTKVLAPPEFVPQVMINRLNIDIFHDKKEFLQMIDKPVTVLPSLDIFIDYDEVADIMMDKFKQWMGK